MYPESARLPVGADPLPGDFSDWVDAKGDRFRDMFSRICFYLAERYMTPSSAAFDETVIVGTEYGNLEAMLRFQRQARSDPKALSAQQFPYATTSSASTFINIGRKITGGNATLNAGAMTPAMVMLHALMHVRDRAPAKSHIFLGDMYCPEAIDDVVKKTGSRQASPAVCYLALTDGNQFAAEITFDDGACAESLASLSQGTRVYLDSGSRLLLGQIRPPDDGTPSASTDEHNRAFVFADFLAGVLSLQPGQRATLLLANGKNVATIIISRRHA